MEQIDLFLHTNRKGEDYKVNNAMRNAWKDALRNPIKVKKWKHIIEEFNDNINSMGIEYLTSYNYNFDIEVDGGVNFSNSKDILKAGANILVSGTTVFKENNGDIKKNIETLKLV